MRLFEGVFAMQRDPDHFMIFDGNAPMRQLGAKAELTIKGEPHYCPFAGLVKCEGFAEITVGQPIDDEQLIDGIRKQLLVSIIIPNYKR